MIFKTLKSMSFRINEIFKNSKSKHLENFGANFRSFLINVSCLHYNKMLFWDGTAESVMCDVIKIRLLSFSF